MEEIPRDIKAFRGNGSVYRHVNADINLLQTAFPDGVAGGLRFSPGAFQHEVMMTALYDPAKGARSEPNGTSRSVGRS
ncbi:MAG: hypothetical protein IH630_07940 [Thermoplasmata archaeon]|nr:hypothetical protein [Thermoplasmata archaeon]